MVNAGLYNVFIECSFEAKDHGTREECQKYLSLCRNNLETAMANLNLLMPAKPESIEALALGVRHQPTHTPLKRAHEKKNKLTIIGHPRHRNLQALLRLDPNLNRRPPLPNPRLPPRLVNGT